MENEYSVDNKDGVRRKDVFIVGGAKKSDTSRRTNKMWKMSILFENNMLVAK